MSYLYRYVSMHIGPSLFFSGGKRPRLYCLLKSKAARDRPAARDIAVLGYCGG